MKRPVLLLASAALVAGLLPGVAAAQTGWTYLQCRTSFYVAPPSATTRPSQPTRQEEATIRVRTSPAGWQRLNGATSPQWDTDMCSLIDFNTCTATGDEVRLVGRRGYTNTLNLRTLRQTYSRLDRSSRTWGEGTCRRIADPTGGR
ncbi:hypothetical protein [Brevundimonas sp.]|uniref:hypothetical protein n=1 Tax=Brevundimonas sp. TaxID=1871086 RepID=UPI003A9213ED